MGHLDFPVGWQVNLDGKRGDPARTHTHARTISFLCGALNVCVCGSDPGQSGFGARLMGAGICGIVVAPWGLHTVRTLLSIFSGLQLFCGDKVSSALILKPDQVVFDSLSVTMSVFFLTVLTHMLQLYCSLVTNGLFYWLALDLCHLTLHLVTFIRFLGMIICGDSWLNRK